MYSEQFEEAVRDYWLIRTAQQQRQTEAGRSDAGSRGEVTGGKQLGALAKLVAQIFKDEGFPDQSIHFERSLELPGYYRPTKQWDILVMHEDTLAAAIELKSIASAFGNNLNNRIEEAVGSSDDFWTAFREGRFGATRPWLGYLFMIADDPKSSRPTRSREPLFSIDEVFRGASYKERAELFCRRLVRERLYDAACFIISSRDPQSEIEEPAEDMTFSRFLASIRGHARYVLEAEQTN